jgi:hypothetical protein
MRLLARNGKSPRAAFRRVQTTRQRLQRNEHLLRSTNCSMGFLFVNEIVECSAAYGDQSVQRSDENQCGK